MKVKPTVAPSESAQAKRLSSPIESLKIIKSDPNLWKFFIGFQLINGTFIAFASNCNFIIKPYGYTDIEIAVNAVVLMGAGVIGSIIFSLYIKKTFNYRMVIRIIAIGSILLMGLLCFWLNTYNDKVVTTILIAIMGFIITPIIPICYDLGSELAFPMGEAQVTGLLNGAGMLWAFIVNSILSCIFGYGTK
jgi:FLVCR family feline leukemia virus subgroup C receptor-related protein